MRATAKLFQVRALQRPRILKVSYSQCLCCCVDDDIFPPEVKGLPWRYLIIALVGHAFYPPQRYHSNVGVIFAG